MKKILVLLIFFYGHLFALEKRSTLKVYHEIFMSVLHKEKINVYTPNEELSIVFKTSRKIVLVDDPNSADIIVIDSDSNYHKLIQKMNLQRLDRVPFFATRYQLLTEYDNILGALYWKKGRSQLLFVRSRLIRFGITLSSEYEPFIVDEL